MNKTDYRKLKLYAMYMYKLNKNISHTNTDKTLKNITFYLNNCIWFIFQLYFKFQLYTTESFKNLK